MSSNSKEDRIDNGLRRLINTLIPDDPSISDEALEAQREHQWDRLRPALNQGPSTSSQDIHEVSDAIRKKLWRTRDSPEAAVRFSNIYSRLLTLPILEKKSGILQLLHLLADHQDTENDVEPSPVQSPRAQRFSPQKADRAKTPTAATTAFQRPRSSLAEATSAQLNQRAPPEPVSKSLRDQFGRSNLEPRPHTSHQDRESRSQPVRQTEPEEAVSPISPINKSPNENALMRDLPFVLQGLSTSNLTFGDSTSLKLPSRLPLPLISILHTLAEPSLLYRNLTRFAQSEQKGLVMQSLQAAVSHQLRAYLGLISTLEGEIRRSLSPDSDGNDPRLSKVGVTLKRCVVWTREATIGLRLMSLIAEEAQALKGGALISMVHKYSTSHGDPFVSAFAERMLAHLTQPFYDMLRQWIYDGELTDPYGEFFVHEPDPDDETKDLDPRKVPATSVWENKYKLKQDLIPTIIDRDFANKVFLIGKSLNFIRYSCGDSAWVETYSKGNSHELTYGDTAKLETSIDHAYKTTMAHLIHLMDTRFNLFEHFDALKRYLLLGQGDFVALLLESLASNLDKPAGSQYRHTLTAQLDHAIRGSNAQFDSPEVLRRLDARLLELMHGEIGWDVFTLEYKVDAPCDVVVTTWASKQYLAVFNLLWRIKRIEFALGSTWRRITTGARTVLASVSGALAEDWKSTRCCIAEMVHFVNQLQYYVMFEVIESSWNELQKGIRKDGVTLDDLIEAHTKYLKTITHRALLGGTKHSVTGNREDSFPTQLHKLLKTMLAYKEAVDGLYSYSVADFTRKQQAAARLQTTAAAGRWGLTDDERMDSPLPGDRPASRGFGFGRDTDSPLPMIPSLDTMNEDHMLPSLRKRLSELGDEFRSRLETLLGDLLIQPDVDLKFLGVAMNYNDVYKPVKRRKRRDKDRMDRSMAHTGLRTEERVAKDRPTTLS